MCDGSAQKGPFSIDEIKQSGIGSDTLVWTEGMGKWERAKDIPELTLLFTIPPPLPASENNDPDYGRDKGQEVPGIPAGPPKSYKGGILIITILIALTLVIVFFIRLSGPTANIEIISNDEEPVITDTAVVLPQSAITPPQIDPEEQARIAEQNTPGRYLSINTAIEKNLLLQPIIKGTVYNKASVTTYEKLALKIVYTGKDGALIGEEYITIEDTIGPGELAEIHHKPAKKAYRRAAGYKITVNAAEATK